MTKIRSDFASLYKHVDKKGGNWKIAFALIKGILNSEILTFNQQVVLAKLIKMLAKQKELDKKVMGEFIQILDVHHLNMFKGLEEIK